MPYTYFLLASSRQQCETSVIYGLVSQQIKGKGRFTDGFVGVQVWGEVPNWVEVKKLSTI